MTSRPHLLNNQFSKGRPKPRGSGRPRIFTDPVSITIKVERIDRDRWVAEAACGRLSLGEYIRCCVEPPSNERI